VTIDVNNVILFAPYGMTVVCVSFSKLYLGAKLFYIESLNQTLWTTEIVGDLQKSQLRGQSRFAIRQTVVVLI
jgi:hypothetical protein